MRLFPSPSVAVAFLIPLIVVLIDRGILPAFTQLDTDFPNYYTAGKIVAHGGDVGRMYDDDWFGLQLRTNGFTEPGKFSPFPPPTALLSVPLSFLDPLTALRVMTVLNCCLLLLCIVLLSRVLPLSVIESAVFCLLSGIGLINCFRFGQLYIVLSFTILLGYYLYMRNKPILAGICFGILVPIKYYPIVFILAFVLMEQWRVVLASLVTILFVCAASVVVLGTAIHLQYLSSVVGNHLLSHFTNQNVFSPAFQSWDSLLRRLFVYDMTLNPHPLMDSHAVFLLLKSFVVALFVSLTLYSLRRLWQRGQPENTRLAFSLLGVLALLVAPGTATYHYLLLWLPIGILLNTTWNRDERGIFWLTLALYALIGFIPYAFFRQFDGRGLLTLIAYPRLALLTGLFILCFRMSLRITNRVEGNLESITA
jgi:hypothetical protein